MYVCNIDCDSTTKPTIVVASRACYYAIIKWRLMFRLATGHDRETAGLILLFH